MSHNCLLLLAGAGLALGAALMACSEDPPTRPTVARECGLPLDSLTRDPANVVVRMIDYDFEPATVQVSRGGTVTWVHCGRGEQHTATSDDDLWDSSFLSPGQRFSRVFAEAGAFGYYCIPHPIDMRGQVTVQ